MIYCVIQIHSYKNSTKDSKQILSIIQNTHHLIIHNQDIENKQAHSEIHQDQLHVNY